MLAQDRFIILAEEDFTDFLETSIKKINSIHFNFPISEAFSKAINRKIQAKPAISLCIDGYYQKGKQVHWHCFSEVRIVSITDFMDFSGVSFSKMTKVEVLSMQSVSFVDATTTFKKMKSL